MMPEKHLKEFFILPRFPSFSRFPNPMKEWKRIKPQAETTTAKEKLQAMSDAEAAIFAAELGDVPSVDLHGLTKDQALNELDAAIGRAYMDKQEVIKIIHGRGKGILERAVQEYLHTHPMIAAFRAAQAAGQQGGVTFAALHKR
jgi:DNA mismatch repair protein MutS2